MRSFLAVVGVLACVACGSPSDVNPTPCKVPDAPNTCACGFHFCSVCRCEAADPFCPTTHDGVVFEVDCAGFDAGQP